ncbi:hypothetical protein D3C81_1216320 [compost metagenome]
MRAAKTQRHAKTLGAAHNHVGTEFTGCAQQGQGQQVSGHRHQRTSGMGALHQGSMVNDSASAGRVLQQQTEIALKVLLKQGRLIADDHLDTQWLGTGAQYVEGLRVTLLRNEKRWSLALRQALAEGHGFGGGGGFIEQRGVGDFHTGQVADQGLEVQQRFQPTLGNLRLVGCVGRVPGRVLQQVAQDRRRCVARVIALTDVIAKPLVLCSDSLERGQRLGLALPFAQREHAGALDAVRNDAVDQAVEAVMTD